MPQLVIDPDHTVAAFHIRHFMVSNVHGQFNGLTGSIEFDPDNVSATSVEVEMDTQSLWTGVANVMPI
jgi:polyisoprenoid-binding protein YceI